MNKLHTEEIESGDRFSFGKNWSRFLQVLNEDRIKRAEASLIEALKTERLDGQSFVDVGSGSGLFSLAARRLGARVFSFDFDPDSVECTRELKRRYFPNDQNWRVDTGSALDTGYLSTLGTFDVVYSWGVLHHTGQMWQALENIKPLVADRGRIFIAIYNDQGGWSSRWWQIKRVYNKLPDALQLPYAALVMLPRELKLLLIACLKLQPASYFQNIRNYSQHSTRGMNYWHDLIDWVGGFPFEVAKPEEIFDFFSNEHCSLTFLRTCGAGVGCNQFVFRKS